MPIKNKNLSHQGILAWPKEDRPRERMQQVGAEALSNSELVAILLRKGVRGKDAVTLSRELIHRFGGLRGLFSAEWRTLSQIRGLGEAKVATVLAVAELSKRQLRERVMGKCVVREPEDVIKYLCSSVQDCKNEVFKALFLDKGNRVLSERILFLGTVDQAVIHPREVVKAALDEHATALILVHNHPSGRVEPSTEDKEITQKLIDACSVVSVGVLDHIIVGHNHYFSFREQGLL